MAGYSLIASESTVQVLSPTVVNDVVYCTLQTHPSGVIASMPVQADVFNAGGGKADLTAFADAIEQVMAISYVVAGVGVQTIGDADGLIHDEVAFTVQFVPSTPAGTSITAEATVPIAMLNFTDGLIGATLLEQVLSIVSTVYQRLEDAATGG